MHVQKAQLPEKIGEFLGLSLVVISSIRYVVFVTSFAKIAGLL
jgi:hypothetical protein